MMFVLTDAASIHVVCRETLLVGNGNQLLLLHLSPDGKTHRKVAPTPRLWDKIHGIASYDIGDKRYLVIFHAGREVYFTTLDCTTFTFSESTLIVFPEKTTRLPIPHVRRRLVDWISSISLLCPSQLCIVTSHGVAVLLERDNKNNELQWDLVDKSPCEDGSTLYCSTIAGNQWENVMCFSGTALGLLLIWSVAGGEDRRGKVMKSITAHNGVIFSIAYDYLSGLLTTTSDDRSLKFWNMQLDKDNNTRIVEIREERYCFAHTSRVFQCRIIKTANQTLVASIGEDCLLCLWNTEGDLLLKKRLDEGPTLWSMDYDHDSFTIFITASNGNLYKYCIHHLIDDSDNESKDPNGMHDISPTLALTEHLAKVKFLCNGFVAAVTNKNLLMILDNNGRLLHKVGTIEQFKCSILESGGCLLFVAGDCTIHVYDVTAEEGTRLIKNEKITFEHDSFDCEGKKGHGRDIIRSLNYCTRSKNIATCDANGRCIVMDASLSKVTSYHRIPHSTERWLTSFVVLDSVLLLMADRSGHLYLFERRSVNPVFKLANVHGKLGITSIIVVQDKLWDVTNYNLRTTGHDGRVCELFLNVADRTLEVLTFTKSNIGWIDRTFHNETEAFHLGFNDSHFLMADDRNELCVQFDCGGGHRCWDFYYNPCSGAFTYIFIQHKKLKIFQYTRLCNIGSKLLLPRLNWHTRACNTLQIVRRGDSYLLLSGGEDNILRINTLKSGEIMEEPRKHLFNHISSIKTIIVQNRLESNSLFVISAGGRAQICVTSIDLNNFRVKQEGHYMLLATDTERSRWKTNRHSTFHPETKFMCGAFISANRIVFGCSDGIIRIYQLACNNGEQSFALASETFYGRCVLKVISFNMDGHSIYVTMATDGYLCFWDSSLPDAPSYKHRHHKSGINAVDMKQIEPGKVIIATGGDDQSITVSLFEINKSQDKLHIQLIEGFCDNLLHTAQVTGITLLDNSKMISTGVDQRVFVSSFVNFTKLEIESSANTCVADVKGLLLLRDVNTIIIYGCGIEIINLQSFHRPPKAVLFNR